MTEYQMRCVNARKPHSHIVSAEVQELLLADRAYGECKPLLVATILPTSAKAYSRPMAENADEGMTREGLTRSLGEGIGALSLVKALVSNLQDKGILTEADIERIESNAAEFFAEDLKAISGEGERAEGFEVWNRRIAEAKC